jgi:hypothetical protein
VKRSKVSAKNKWDNLLGEIKKVKDYERKRPSGKPGYFQMSSLEKKEAALPSNVAKDVYDLVVELTRGKAAIDPPSVLESANGRDGGDGEYLEEEGDDVPLEEQSRETTGKKRKLKWGAAKKELLGTLKDNGKAMENQLKASEEGRQQRHQETFSFTQQQWEQELELRKKQISFEEQQVQALGMIAMAFSKIADKMPED